jgi:hypothetical protein
MVSVDRLTAQASPTSRARLSTAARASTLSGVSEPGLTSDQPSVASTVAAIIEGSA